MQRLVLGALASVHDSTQQVLWNRFFEKEGIDAFCDFYRTKPCNGKPCTEAECLHMRLSDMFLHDRSAYILDASLSPYALPLLDDIDASAENHAHVNVILNERGVLRGYFFEAIDAEEGREHVWKLIVALQRKQ